MSHNCHCQTGRRTLLLRGDHFATNYHEIAEFGATTNWTCDESAGRVEIPISGCGTFNGLMSVVNFLRTIVSADKLESLEAAWQPQTETGRSAAEPDWKPITAMASVDSSPLLKILTERRIETYLQPIFLADGLELWGYECLMRARGDDGKMISPATIIQWAKQEQLVFMLDRVCRETHLLNAGKLDIPKHAKLLINFLPTAIYQPEYCLRTTMEAARKSDLEPGRIIFEVVESEEVTDRDHLARILEYYREANYGVALDDLGSGYAGLSLLADLNPDLIKIDRELVSNATKNLMHRKICEALIRIGRETGKLVLAEGVETPAELALMQECGATLIQGFLLGKPQPVPAVEPLQFTAAAAA
jgi:EAL domain-containing protein (putative c-di-GMP-specific phosphodiesterase class I)